MEITLTAQEVSIQGVGAGIGLGYKMDGADDESTDEAVWEAAEAMGYKAADGLLLDGYSYILLTADSEGIAEGDDIVVSI